MPYDHDYVCMMKQPVLCELCNKSYAIGVMKKHKQSKMHIENAKNHGVLLPGGLLVVQNQMHLYPLMDALPSQKKPLKKTMVKSMVPPATSPRACNCNQLAAPVSAHATATSSPGRPLACSSARMLASSCNSSAGTIIESCLLYTSPSPRD